MSVLECGGTYKKPYADEDKKALEKAGLGTLDVHSGLPIYYRACGRIGKKAKDSRRQRDQTRIRHNPPLVTHIQYKIELPTQWNKLLKIEREAVLRGLPLCSHIKALDFGTEDLIVPTKAEDIARDRSKGRIGLEGRMVVERRCVECAAEAQFDPGPGYKLTLDVWRYYEALVCNDGIPCAHHKMGQSNPASGPRKVFGAADKVAGDEGAGSP